MTLHGFAHEGGDARLFRIRGAETNVPSVARFAVRRCDTAPAPRVPDHPALLRSRSVGEDATVLPLIEGATLAAYLDARGPFTERHTRTIVAWVAAGLRALHEGDLAHLDIKPGNLMVDTAGRVVVIDTAELASADGRPIRRGTPPFTIPGAVASPSTDWVALGRTATMLATGNPLTPVTQLPVGLRDLVAGLLDGISPTLPFDPADRLEPTPLETIDPHDRPTIDFGQPETGATPATSPAGGLGTVALAALLICSLALVVGPQGTDRCAEPAARTFADAAFTIDRGGACPAHATFDDSTGVLSVFSNGQVQRFGVGQPGDEVTFGDWNCDNTVTPGLHRGQQLLVFDGWPEDVAVHARAIAEPPSC